MEFNLNTFLMTNLSLSLPKVRFLLLSIFILAPLLGVSQENDSLNKPLIPTEKVEFLKNVYMSMDMRMAFRSYVLRGGEHDYQGNQFENEYTALNIRTKIHEKVSLNFRNRFNKTTSVQSLDQLGNNIELANIAVQFTPKLSAKFGRQDAYFGGYEYSFSGMEIMVYNDIQSNALAYVTGVGVDYDLSPTQSFGVQVLNSRTMHYDDKYGDDVAENIQEPDWPVEVVGRWRGKFFDGKLETRYSYSYSREVKGKGTQFITLGHRYKHNKFTIMYDFDYSYEQVDTKGVATAIIGGENVAQKASYIENWIRTEYKFNPQFTGLLTLMTNSTYGKNLNGETSDKKLLRKSIGVIPTFYYRPFDDIDLRFFLTYIHRYYDYSNIAKEQFGATSYNRNEVRFGFISPLRFL